MATISSLNDYIDGRAPPMPNAPAHKQLESFEAMDQVDLNQAIASIQADEVQEADDVLPDNAMELEGDFGMEDVGYPDHDEEEIQEEIELAPLPTGFYPDIDEVEDGEGGDTELAVSALQPAVPESPVSADPELSWTNGDTLGLEGVNKVIEQPTQLTSFGQGADAEMASSEEGPRLHDIGSSDAVVAADQVDDQEDVQDPALREILQSLAENGEGDDVSIGSPLTPLPELPTELPSMNEIIIEQPSNHSESQVRPLIEADYAGTTPKSVSNGFQDLPAESSNAASKRSPVNKSSKPKPKSTKTKRPREEGSNSHGRVKKATKKSAGDGVPHGDDDLRSLNGEDSDKDGTYGESQNGDGKKKKAKKAKREIGPDGKPVRVSGKSRIRLDASLGIHHDGDVKTPEKIQPRSRVFAMSQLKIFLKGKTKETQLAPCIRPRYEKWGKCTQCVAKVGGDSCRFRNNRVFRIDPDTTEILGIAPFEATEWEGKITPLPTEFNRPLEDKHILRIERTVAPLLLPLITRELKHSINRQVITRGVDAAQHRSVCDFCSSTIFGGFFFCKKCGRDFCLQCENYFPDTLEEIRDSPWPLPDAARPRLMRCTAGVSASAAQTTSESPVAAEPTPPPALPTPTPEPEPEPQPPIEAGSAEEPSIPEIQEASGRRSRNVPRPSYVELPLPRGDRPPPKPKIVHLHVRGDLQSASRFSTEELQANWKVLVEFVMDGTEPIDERLQILGLANGSDKDVDRDLIKAIKEIMEQQPPEAPINGASDSTVLTDQEVANLYTKITNPEAIPIPDPAGLEELSLPFLMIKDGELDNSKFDILWGKGEPLVVDGVGDKFKLSWTPDGFIEQFGEEACHVVDCQTNAVIFTTVGKFFEKFKNADERTGAIWKLKDWPSSNDFQSAYPTLYNDFCDSLPVPDYTRRNGVLNLYSHFPPGATRPDIGPKMYNAFEAVESTGGFGSTRLHMDVADAINIMLYASKRSNDQPGCAVWDLYRAEDADTIRTFLRKKFGHRYKFTDPIHSQLFYLDASLRKELLEKYGVVSWRVYQYPGQAVFIPAGCAHQVCNLADCIKIALDFVSPHNVTRCQELTKDFRNENFVMAWKEDVLQLYNIMWYAWLSSRQTRERRRAQAQEVENQQAARAAYLAQLEKGEHEAIPGHLAVESHLRHSQGPGILSPAISSLRGTGGLESSERLDGDIVLGEVSKDFPPLLDDLSNISKTNGHTTNPGQPITPISSTRPITGVQPINPEIQSPTRDKLIETLLQTSLTRRDPIPSPPEPSKAVKPGYNISKPPDVHLMTGTGSHRGIDGGVEEVKAKPRIASLIRLGALPLDLAVSAARAAMGEGGEGDGDEDGFGFGFGFGSGV